MYYKQLEDKVVTTENFLELASELWIHKKYDIMIKEATKVIENVADPQPETEIDDLIDAIFVNDNPPKRVRRLCTKYYGEDWDNS